MKKIIYSAMAVAMLATTSCKDDFAESFVGDQATVEFSISTPEIGTRAFSDGTTATVLQYAVYDADGKELTALTKTDGTINGSATISLQLKNNKSYQMVVWAAAPNAPYAVDFSDKTMKVDYTNATCNDESRDAFYAYTEFTVNGNKTERIELKRPFAQLNIGASDFEKAGKSGYVPTHSQVTVRNVYSTFNFASGKAGGENEVTFKYAELPKATDGSFPVTGNDYLAMNYILVSNDQETVEVYVEHKNDKEGDSKTIGSVPLKRNYRTNIYGSLLTSTTDVNVEIEPDFEDSKYTVLEAFENGGTVTLTENVVIDRPLVVKAGVKAVLNLNDKSIINNTASEEFGEGEGIIVYGDLTINGKGTVQGKTMAVWARGNSGAKVVINGGTYKGCAEGFAKGGRSVVYASSGNVIDIYGGEFQALAADKTSYLNKTEGVYAALNVADNNGVINVYGGRFYKQNPAAPGTEPKAWNDAHLNGFVAKGYTTVADGDDWYKVVPVVVKQLMGVTTATTVELTENVVVRTGQTIQTQDATGAITINGNGKSLVSEANSVDDFQWDGNLPDMSTILSSDNGAKVTVNNLNFEGTMHALMLGHYVDSNSDWYNTELNNVNVINTKVVSFSANIAPAVCIYGQAELNNCNMYGTTLSELDTDHMWPVYDVAIVNGAKVKINGGHIGSILLWAKTGLTIENGAVVDLLEIQHLNTSYDGVLIKNGTTVKVLDLSKVKKDRIAKLVIEDGAKIGKIVANGVEYATVQDFVNVK